VTGVTRICFVCLGNICRSPLAEGVFLHLANERGVSARFQVDSSGTGGWHVGSKPDRRSIAVARAHGVELPSRARQFEPRDVDRFDLFIAMDKSNQATLIDRGVPGDRVRLLRAYTRDGIMSPHRAPDVPDPYYGGEDGFGEVYNMVRESCQALLDSLIDDARP
jgi:protein-tyrosine phosphatase